MNSSASAAATSASTTTTVDYVHEGRLLLERLGVNTDSVRRYDPCNAVYIHPKTRAVLYVGNHVCAANRNMLTEHGVRHIVFCQDSDGKCHFEGDPEFTYLRFPISQWYHALGHGHTAVPHKRVLAYFAPLFDFVDEALAAGHNVLIHCLAGAHRAGTAGIASLMHLCEIDVTTAVAMAKRARPAINPIGSFPRLLQLLEGALLEAT